MRIALIGYGKMGKTIEKIALERNHQIVARIDFDNLDELKSKDLKADVAIEFTQPEAAYQNIRTCIENGIPVVSGTTGWLEKRNEIEKLCLEKKGGFFYASNYSIGVNLFFKLNKMLAKMMNNYPEYSIEMEEIHHTEKKDAPSGTAITLAEGIIDQIKNKKSWINEPSSNDEALPIISLREANVPGTHTIRYNSSVDTIEIKHTAHTRSGFALGAVLAAEWLVDKKGNFGMDDLLNFE